MTKIFYLDAVTGKATLGRAIMFCNGAVVNLIIFTICNTLLSKFS